MSTMSADNDFYEADEPVADVIRAFKNAEKGRTRRPRQGRTEYLAIHGLPVMGTLIVESHNTVQLVTSS